MNHLKGTVMVSSISRNITQVREIVSRTALQSGRSADDVVIVAVSKTVGPSEIEMAWREGLTIFAENRVQDVLWKMAQVQIPLTWHFIGHLQTNKVKQIVGKVALIHSVDSWHLAEKIDQEAKKRGLVQDVLLEVNVTGEQSKYGLHPDEVAQVCQRSTGLVNVRIRGLMTMAPFTDDERVIRSCFKGLRELRDSLRSHSSPDMALHHLSMGMSNDYQLAIEEGATLIRIGSALFHPTEDE